MRGRRDAYRVLIGRVHGKKPRGRPKHRWEDKRITLKWGGMELTDLTSDWDR
jgi:hypothetical protein